MIKGRIRNHEAIIELAIRGSPQAAQRVEAVIDTGYNGYLTVPGDLTSSLALAFAGHRRGTLADGSTTVLDMYLASVVWHGRQQDVLVAKAAGTPLIGMSLLRGSRMTMDVVDGGDVIIEQLS